MVTPSNAQLFENNNSRLRLAKLKGELILASTKDRLIYYIGRNYKDCTDDVKESVFSLLTTPKALSMDEVLNLNLIEAFSEGEDLGQQLIWFQAPPYTVSVNEIAEKIDITRIETPLHNAQQQRLYATLDKFKEELIEVIKKFPLKLKAPCWYTKDGLAVFVSNEPDPLVSLDLEQLHGLLMILEYEYAFEKEKAKR